MAKSLIQEAKALRKKWQALLQANTDTMIINCEDLTDKWRAGTMENPVVYELGEICNYNGQVYSCHQAHTHSGEAGWEPDTASSLWHIKHTTDVTNPKPFVQPLGSHDVYMNGEAVIFEEKVYICAMDNCAYSPSAYPQGWKLAE